MQTAARASRNPKAAFTLLELLVVITIIIIMTTVSVVLFGSFTQDKKLKSAGSIVQSAFNKARQLATSERVWHFVVFDTTTNPQQMIIWRDADRDFRLNVNKDQRVECQDPIVLPDNVVFNTTSSPNAMWGGAPPHLAFRPDGTIEIGGPSPGEDRALDPASLPAHANHGQYAAKADLLLEQTGAPGSLYVDFSAPTGKVLKVWFYAQ
jgi:type II secretory pathway pseudopilin PulG